jgi:hypothetical protein
MPAHGGAARSGYADQAGDGPRHRLSRFVFGAYDPETNLRWGMKYLGGAYKLGRGDTCATALRYQGGHRATRMSASSRRYCAELKRKMAAVGG